MNMSGLAPRILTGFTFGGGDCGIRTAGTYLRGLSPSHEGTRFAMPEH